MTDQLHVRTVHLRAEGDEEARTVSGIAVPWDTPTKIRDWFGSYTETFERGSVELPASGTVQLWWRHEEPIGRITEHRDDEAGWFITAHISKTARGDEAYALLRDGVLSEFSIGFEPVEHRADDETGDITRTRVIAREVSVVPFGAYGQGAAVAEVRERPNPTKEHVMTDATAPDLAEVRETVEDLERRFQTFTADRTEEPVADTRSAGAFLRDLARGDEATIASYNRSQEFLYEERAYTGGTSADAPVKDAWVGDLTRIFDSSSGVLAQLFSTGTLPKEGNSIEYAELLANTVQVTEQAAEGDDLAYGKVTLTTKNAPVKTYGGYVQLTRQAIERSTLPVLNRSLEALAIAAGARKKAVLRTAYNTLVTAREGIASNGGVVLLGATLATATAGNWEDALIDAAIKYDAENAAPEAMVVSATVFKKLRSLTVSGERVFIVSEKNASGTLNLPGLTGQLAGLPVYLDPGQAGDKAVFVNGRAIRQYDSALVSLQDENIINLSKDFSVYRYGAVAPEVPQFVVPVKLAAS
ncbi:MAG: HK97 family phage prohead protease [Cryobacterium sp.]|nr:HK97 family phage prohead protease [Cryobacterium sp.]